MKLTKYKISIIALALILLISLTAFLGLNFKPASAAGTVSVSGSNVFTATSKQELADRAIVVSDKKTVDGKDKYYSSFRFVYDSDTVSYRRNLAYSWYAQADGDDEAVYGESRNFSMALGFNGLGFNKFVVTFESQQYNKTKDSKSVNYVMFFPAEEDKVYALITTDKEATVDDLTTKTAVKKDRITISFDGKGAGYYDVSVKDSDGTVAASDKFENVGGNFAKASTSSSSPVYPLIFNTVFDKPADAEDSAEEQANTPVTVNLYSINGQEFELNSAPTYDESKGYYPYGAVKDTCPPVLCMNEDLRYFEVGSELDADFTVIDVLRSSPSHTVYYYLLTYEDFNSADIDFFDADIFKEAKSGVYLETSTSENAYRPSEDLLMGKAFNSYETRNGKLTAEMLVRVKVELTDISTNSETDEVYLDWYVDNAYKLGIGGPNSDFLAVVDGDKLGASYIYNPVAGEAQSVTEQRWKDAVAEYQKEVDKAAEDLAAGSSNYIYLPSPEKLFTDNASSYTDMKYSIYYYSGSKSSNANLAYNNLSINIAKDGDYRFTVYAIDAAGNNMYYLEKATDAEIAKGDYDVKIYDENNNEVYYRYKTFAASEIWNMFSDEKDEGLADKLPWFTFHVSYKGVEFEEQPGMQTTGYVGTAYNSATFKINGVSGSYSTNYRLFIFDRAQYYKLSGENLTYEQFIDKKDELYDGDYRVCFEEIEAVTEESEPDLYEKYKDYAWSNSSTSFVPQSHDTDVFYYMLAEVTDDVYKIKTTCSLAVVASETAQTLKGEDDWLKNNVASVVLLCVAGVSLIGIVLLLVIKPKNKGDIDVEFEKKAEKKAKKNK